MILAITGRELRSLLLSPVAWLLLAVMQLILAWLFLDHLERFIQLQPQLAAVTNPPGVSQLIIRPLLDSAATLMMLLMPLLSMGAFSRELASGNIQLLFSAPLRLHQIVLGKYLALLLLALPMLLLVALMPLSLLLGSDIDPGTLAAGLLGLALVLASYAAIGLLFSSLTQQPAVAAAGSYGILLLLWIINLSGGEWFARLALSVHFQRLASGLVSTPDVAYFLLLILLSLTLTLHRLERLHNPHTTPPGSTPFRRVAGHLQGTLFYLLLAAAILLTAALVERHGRAWDWSQGARNSLSPVSQALLQQIETPLLITSFAPEDAGFRERIRQVIARYQRLQPLIRLNFIDPSKEPVRTRALGIRLAGELYIEYQGRSERLQQLDEQHLSDAIARLIDRGDRWIVAIGGHGERKPDGTANHDLGNFSNELRRKGYRLQTLLLAERTQIPDNTGLLIIASPQVDYRPDELAAITAYLERGGNLLWLSDPGNRFGLDPLAEQLGISFLPGTLVDANGARAGLDDPAIALVTGYPDHPATRDFDLTTLYPYTAALQISGDSDWQASPLLQTLPGSWNETGEIRGQVRRDPSLGEQAGPLTIGLALQRDRPDGQPQRLLVIGDGDFLSNAYLGSGGNLDLGLRLIRWLTHSDRLQRIPARISQDRTLQLSTAQGISIGLGFLLLLPLLLATTGGVIWWRRRRL